MAKLEGNSLKFTTLPPRNRCFSRCVRLINRAACIPLIQLYRNFVNPLNDCRFSLFFSLLSSIKDKERLLFFFRSPPQRLSIIDPGRYRTQRYTSNVVLSDVGIDRCSCSPKTIITGNMFHAILKLHCGAFSRPRTLERYLDL